jgi:hypothetical protein
MYILCIRYVEMEAHEVYEMYNETKFSCNAD